MPGAIQDAARRGGIPDRDLTRRPFGERRQSTCRRAGSGAPSGKLKNIVWVVPQGGEGPNYPNM